MVHGWMASLMTPLTFDSFSTSWFRFLYYFIITEDIGLVNIINQACVLWLISVPSSPSAELSMENTVEEVALFVAAQLFDVALYESRLSLLPKYWPDLCELRKIVYEYFTMNGTYVLLKKLVMIREHWY